jgi:hypothetical protein
VSTKEPPGGIGSAYRRQSVSATSTRCSKSLSNFDRARHGPEGRRGLPHHPQNKSSVLVLNSSTVDGTVMGLTLSGEPAREAPEPHPYLVHQRTPGPVPRPRPIPSVTSVTSVRCFPLARVSRQGATVSTNLLPHPTGWYISSSLRLMIIGSTSMPLQY